MAFFVAKVEALGKMAQLSLEQAKKILGKNASRYSDTELSDYLTRLRKLAENVYPIVVKKMTTTSRK